MNKVTIEKPVQVLGALAEGNSIGPTVRMTGAAKNTVLKLLRDIGQVCELYQRNETSAKIEGQPPIKQRLISLTRTQRQ